MSLRVFEAIIAVVLRNVTFAKIAAPRNYFQKSVKRRRKLTAEARRRGEEKSRNGILTTDGPINTDWDSIRAVSNWRNPNRAQPEGGKMGRAAGCGRNDRREFSFAAWRGRVAKHLWRRR